MEFGTKEQVGQQVEAEVEVWNRRTRLRRSVQNLDFHLPDPRSQLPQTPNLVSQFPGWDSNRDKVWDASCHLVGHVLKHLNEGTLGLFRVT